MDEATRRFAAAADLDAFVAELWARVPIGAAVSVEPRHAHTAAVTAEIVDEPENLSARRKASARQLSRRDASTVAVALKAAFPNMKATEAAHLVTRDPRTVRDIWTAAEGTGEMPVVKPRDNGGRMGFSANQ
jgi:TusA-related sulfurtransferase